MEHPESAPSTEPTWWPVTVTWPNDRIVDAVHATTREEAQQSSADNWPGAEIHIH